MNAPSGYGFTVDEPLIAYVDESQRIAPGRNTYILCASLVPRQQLESIREYMGHLKLPGQRKLHWHKEGERRRRAIAEDLSNLNVRHLIVIRNAGEAERPERRRRRCLEGLLFALIEHEVREITLESRGRADDIRDREMLDALRARRVVAGQVRFDHIPGAREPLLWIPDAVAGMVNSKYAGGPAYLSPLSDRHLIQTIEV